MGAKDKAILGTRRTAEEQQWPTTRSVEFRTEVKGEIVETGFVYAADEMHGMGSRSNASITISDSGSPSRRTQQRSFDCSTTDLSSKCIETDTQASMHNRPYTKLALYCR